MSWRDRAEKVIVEAPSKAVKATSGWRERAMPVTESKPVEAALQGFGQGALFGYLPELQAGAGKVLEPIYELATGRDVPDESFNERLSAFRGREKSLAETNPGSFTAGQLAGAVSTPGLSAGRGAGFLSTVARGAAAGAGTGFLYNPNEEGSEAGFNLDRRLEQAKSGAITGGLVSGGLKAVQKGLEGVAKAPKELKKIADSLGLKAAGAKTGDVKKVLKKKRIEDLGEFLRNEDLIGAGKTVEETLERSNQILGEAGPQIGTIYNQVKQELASPFVWSKLKPEQARKIADNGLWVSSVNDEIKDVLKKFTKGKSGGKQAMGAVETELETLAELAGKTDEFDITDLLAYRRSLDDRINFDKTVRDMPLTQQSLVEVRSVIQGRIDRLVDTLDEVLGGDRLKILKSANARFRNASDIKNIAQTAVSRDRSNMVLGLPEIILGTGVGGADLIRSISEGDLEGGASAVAKGALAAGALKLGRKYGPGAASKVAGKASSLLSKSGVPKGAGKAARAAEKAAKKAPGLLERVK